MSSVLDWSNPCGYFASNKLPASTVREKRQAIADEATTNVPDDRDKWDAGTLESLVKLYDKHFFEGGLLAAIAKRGIKVQFSIGDVKTSDALKDRGTTGFVKPDANNKTVLLHINLPLVSDVISKEPKRHTMGIDCSSLLSCIQIVLEHELVHLIIVVFCYRQGKTWDGTGHNKMFKTIRYNWFRHLSDDATVGQPQEEARLWTTMGQHMYSAKRLRALIDLNLKKGAFVKIPDKITGWHPDLVSFEGFAGAYVMLPDDVRKLEPAKRYRMVVQLKTMKQVVFELRMSQLELLPEQKEQLKALRELVQKLHESKEADIVRKPYIDAASGDWVVDLKSKGKGVSLISLISK